MRRSTDLPDYCLAPTGQGIVPSPRLGMCVRVPTGRGLRFIGWPENSRPVPQQGGIDYDEWILIKDEQGYFWRKST
jgi:hypothetical protein